MKHKVLSAVLLFVLVLAMVPTVALASEPPAVARTVILTAFAYPRDGV